MRKTLLGLISFVPARRAELETILLAADYDVAPIAASDPASLPVGLSALVCDARDAGAVACAEALRRGRGVEHIAFVALDGSPPGWADAAIPSGSDVSPAIERAIRSRRQTAARAIPIPETPDGE